LHVDYNSKNLIIKRAKYDRHKKLVANKSLEDIKIELIKK